MFENVYAHFSETAMYALINQSHNQSNFVFTNLTTKQRNDTNLFEWYMVH